MTEMQELQHLLGGLKPYGVSRELGVVEVGKKSLPIVGLVIGSQDKTAPTLGLFGGVHGLERVGTHVVINYLRPLLKQMAWDRDLRRTFEHVRLVSIPIVNPGGMLMNRRSNPKGVDIMRNAPIDAEGNLKWLVSGHRVGPWLPWYRGVQGEPMEIETQTLIQFVRDEMLESRFSFAVDVHSGFGMRDRFWYPYSSSAKDFPYFDCVSRLQRVMNQSIPYHVYKVQPQAESYLLHGDPWDLLFNEHYEKFHALERKFIPWCLEMGSWTWLRKNPRQLFYKDGIFNPVLPHRYNRIMRRHKPLFDFLRAAVLNHGEWVQT